MATSFAPKIPSKIPIGTASKNASPSPIAPLAPDNAPSQRQMEQKAFEVSYYRNQAEQLQTQIEFLQKALVEVEGTKKAIAQLDTLKKGALLSMGAGTYAQVKTDSIRTVLIDIGSRVMVEKKPDEAIKILDFRKTLLEKNLGEFMAAFEKTLARYEQLAAQAQQMAALMPP